MSIVVGSTTAVTQSHFSPEPLTTPGSIKANRSGNTVFLNGHSHNSPTPLAINLHLSGK